MGFTTSGKQNGVSTKAKVTPYRLLCTGLARENDNNKKRFENYRGFKQILKFESYLSYLTIKRYRGARVRIQSELNELACNNYTYNPNIRQRLCPVCESAEEDEIHLIFACRAHDNISKDSPLICYKETQQCRQQTEVFRY